MKTLTRAMNRDLGTAEELVYESIQYMTRGGGGGGGGSEFRSCVNRDVGLIPYPILPPSQISHTVSVDVKHREGKRRNQGEAKISLKSECLLLALKRVPFEGTNTSGMNSDYCIAEVTIVLRKSLETTASVPMTCKVSGDRKCHTSA